MNFSVPTHDKFLKRERECLFVGGMPEVVLSFVDENALPEVPSVDRSIG